MPAVKKYTDKYESDKKKLMLTCNIEMHQKKMGYTNEKMGASLALHPKTYRKKVLHPELFTYLEIVKVFCLLKFTEEEILESV